MAKHVGNAADLLVIFGITGDLTRRMTFRALYRLERRGMVGCPVVGVSDHLTRYGYAARLPLVSAVVARYSPTAERATGRRAAQRG
jgi:glucose-6-phosphate 1-dehydrogenase